jgi:hypothetical protein
MFRRLALVALALALTACVAPASSFAAYEEDAVNTTETVLSAVETARLTVRISDGKAFPPTVTILFEEAEDDAAGAQSTFDSVQPPDERSDRLREDLDRLLSEAVTTLADLRIAARRSELETLPSIAEPLESLSTRLEDFAEAHS